MKPMNAKASALSNMAEEGDNYKEPSTTEEDMQEDTSEGEDTCCVKCACGADLMCKSCGHSTCECNC
jgi:hypothetical protein